MEDNRKTVGQLGEDEAAKYLKKNGYEIIERNYMISHSEIDIIAKNEKYIVFVEVRSKTGTQFGSPEDSMSNSKRRQVRKTAELYLLTNKYKEHQIRFDFIGVVFENNNVKINHLINAF